MRNCLGTACAVTMLGIALALPAQAAGGENELLGTLMGAGLGGLVGNQIGHGPGRVAATGTGIFLGGWLGNSMGRSLDQPRDFYTRRPAIAGAGTPYYGPSPLYYSSTAYVPNYVAPPAPPPPPPAPIYMDDSSGSYCREFSQQVRIGDQVQESYGTACLQPDGTWHIVP